jgi:hypothetical protein
VTITEQSKQLCALTLSAGRGLCTLSARQLATGSYILVATYSGNTLYLSSSKTLKLVVVGPKATTTVLDPSESSLSYGHEQLGRLSVTTKTARIGSPTGKARAG